LPNRPAPDTDTAADRRERSDSVALRLFDRHRLHGLVGDGCEDASEGTGEVRAGSGFSSRSLMQDRNASDASRLPAILTDQRGSLPLGKVMVIFSEAAKSSSKALATAAVLEPP